MLSLSYSVLVHVTECYLYSKLILFTLPRNDINLLL